MNHTRFLENVVKIVTIQYALNLDRRDSSHAVILFSKVSKMFLEYSDPMFVTFDYQNN